VQQRFDRFGEVMRVAFPKLERDQHRANGAIEFFMLSRLVVGVGGLAVLPPAIVLLGLNRLAWVAVILGLAAQLGALVLAADQKARFSSAYALSFAGLATALTGLSGHMGLVALIPCVIEAGFMLDRVYALLTGTMLALMVAVTLAAGDGLTALAPLGTAAYLSSFMLALTATGIGVAALLDRIAARENAIQDLQSASSALVDAVDRGVAIADTKGHIHDPSFSFMDMTGLSHHEIAGPAFLERVHVLSRPAYLKAVSDALHSEMAIETRIKLECRGLENDALYRDFDLRVSAIASTDHEAEPHAVISLAYAQDSQIDLTPLRDTLYQAQLRHELKTPLNAILGFSELLTNTAIVPENDPRRTDYIRIIATSARHLVDIIDHMKADSEAQVSEPASFDAVDIPSLVKEALAMLKLSADAHRVLIEEQIDMDLPALLGERVGLRQILINLLSNAVKYAPEGRVVIAAEKYMSGVQISVSDDGIGMDDQELQRVGEPFFRGSALESGFEDGEGLGLAVVHSLVERHGGEITIESAPGNGTTVRVTFMHVKPHRYQTLRALAEIDAGQSPVPVDLALNEEWRRKIA